MRPSARLLRILGGTLALCLSAGAILAYDYFRRPSDGAPYIWPKHWTAMYTSPTFLPTSDYKGIMFRSAANAWSNTPGTDFRFVVVDGFHDSTIGDLDGANDVYFTYLGYYTLGICYVSDQSGKLVVDPARAGNALFDCDIGFSNYLNIWDTGYFDFQSTAVHELGHALGLAHSGGDAATTVMNPYLYPYTQTRKPGTDDVAGEDFLYVPPPGGGRGFPAPNTGTLPLRQATMSDLAASTLDVLVGDPITFAARVENGTGGQILLSGVETKPSSTGAWEDTLVENGSTRVFTLERTVADLPGEYETQLRLGGVDTTAVYLAQQTLLGDRLRVRRPSFPLHVQDDLAASLGPSGRDALDVLLLKGERFALDFRGAPEWGGGVGAVLLDPSGAPVPGWAPARTTTARSSGIHRLVMANPTGKAGNYRIFSMGKGKPPAATARGALGGAAPAEIPFTALARTGGVVEVRGSRKLAPRITALRSPSGAELEIAEGTSIAVEEFAEDGTWTAVVEGAPGQAGNFTLKVKTSWVPGESIVR